MNKSINKKVSFIVLSPQYIPPLHLMKGGLTIYNHLISWEKLSKRLLRVTHNQLLKKVYKLNSHYDIKLF